METYIKFFAGFVGEMELKPWSQSERWCVISDYLSTSSSTTTMYQRHSLQEEMEKELLIDFLVNCQCKFCGRHETPNNGTGRMVSHNLWTMFSVVDGRLYLALWDGDMVQKVVG
ncbi:uncharacterized protein LOC125422525 isoform X6 [Ziziphus jujuba]|uniref:Uncharacterized protein LOC125422525 isoform X6 n=1 Tax=Ziziphus jujuba TaxID=326968 RepID=A0ABM4A309_ZIZJJ|nr:uncharacterized protein LOC125422525 isoform X6 [Ziziphus jujuba]